MRAEAAVNGHRLYLGAGLDHRAGYVNVDLDPHVRPDVIFDLNVVPYPVRDESCSEILALHVFEHLHVHSTEWLRECYRILRPHGVMRVAFPNMFGLRTRIRYLMGRVDEGLEWHPYHCKLIHWRYFLRLARHIGFDCALEYGPRVRRLVPGGASLRMLAAANVNAFRRRRP